MTRLQRAVCIALLLAASPSGALAAGPAKGSKPASPAQKTLSESLKGPAKADFDAASLLAGDKDFAGALVKFQSAYDTSKDPRLLWNIVVCQKNLRHYAKAVAVLRRYLDEGASVLPEQDKKDARDVIATIEPFTTSVTITVNEPGASVFVDEELVGTSPLPGPVALDIGERRLRVEKEGFTRYEHALVVGGSAQATTTVTLEREVRQGKLVVEPPPGATVFVDDKAVGQGKVELTLSAGGHQLRVTAKGMRPYQSEVVLEDKATRQVSVSLEAEAPPEKPKLRVAVGCADPEPRAPDDGLVVYTDGMEVLPPGPVKSRLNPEAGRNVVDYVEYPIDAGKHRLRIASAHCQPLDQDVDVDPIAGALVLGALPSDRSPLLRGPEGAPGWGRLAVGLWMPGWWTVKDHTPEQYAENGLSMTGVFLDAGLVDRWFAAYVNASYAAGSFQRQTFTTNYALPSTPSATWEQISLRFGPRLPLGYASLGLGVSASVQEVNLDKVRTGYVQFAPEAYVELDVQPFCDWGALARGTFGAPVGGDTLPFAALQFGVFWEPNPRCRVEQATTIGLKAEDRPPPQPQPAAK